MARRQLAAAAPPTARRTRREAVLLAAVISLVGALFGTPLFIRFLVQRGYGQFIRDDGPTSHHTKRGTPTMGGAVIIGRTLVATAWPTCSRGDTGHVAASSSCSS